MVHAHAQHKAQEAFHHTCASCFCGSAQVLRASGRALTRAEAKPLRPGGPAAQRVSQAGLLRRWRSSWSWRGAAQALKTFSTVASLSDPASACEQSTWARRLPAGARNRQPSLPVSPLARTVGDRCDGWGACLGPKNPKLA